MEGPTHRPHIPVLASDNQSDSPESEKKVNPLLILAMAEEAEDDLTPQSPTNPTMRRTPPPTLKSASTTVLPDIPQLPPISLTSSPSMESFSTALTRPYTPPLPVDTSSTTFSFGSSPASPSSSTGGVSYSYASTSPPLRGVSSVQHLRLSDPDDVNPHSHSPPPPTTGNWIRIPPATTYDSEGGGTIVTSRAYSTASLNRGNMSDGPPTGAPRIKREGSGVSLPGHSVPRTSGRTRSASLLGMVSTMQPPSVPSPPAPIPMFPRSSASMQNLQQAATPRPVRHMRVN